MFSDMFGESPADVHKQGEGGKDLLVLKNHLQVKTNGVIDNFDNAEGYYTCRFGEVLYDQYEVIANLGKGVFSTVVRARDWKAGRT
ncbi:hypothetical protein IFM89_017158 [Coptis chinensis]|uniref:Protein kinase domain-containing protein n=1 Tax=Coptis chinensis TaxID=261450 RepID=A0A835HVC9_9MAGN|nr:hypothetical protein IFM89_017158 [Coptis chinensis]